MNTKLKILCVMTIFSPCIALAQVDQVASLSEPDRIEMNSSQIKDLNIKLDKLDKMIENQNYKDARSYIAYYNISPSATSERLKKWALRGDTAATWILAEQYYKAKRNQESANWTYTAFLGTRIDANLCINKTAAGLERNVVSSFFDTVQSARRDATIMRDAIVFAIDTQSTIKAEERRPLWLCSLVQHDSSNNGLMDSSLWSTEIERQIKIFTEQTKRK